MAGPGETFDFDPEGQGELLSREEVEGLGQPQWEQREFPLETPESLHPSGFTVVDAFDDVQDPTSTTNPDRPRTLLAAYIQAEQRMIVMFRDGPNQLWEYRNVPHLLWYNFRRSYSKGWFLYASGLDRWPDMGPANLSGITQSDMQYFMVRAQLAQTRAGGIAPGQSATRSKRTLKEDAKIKQAGILTPRGDRISNPYVERQRKRRGI